MKDFPDTLGGFFVLDDSKEGAEDMSHSSELSAQIRNLTGVSLEGHQDTFLEALRAVLDIPCQDIMLKAWSHLDDLQTLADPEQTASDKEVIKRLAKHRIESEHTPKLELLLNNKPVGEIKFDFVFSAELEGFILRVKAGHVREIRTGSFQAKGMLSFAGKTRLERATQAFKLPGRLRLDPPFAIPRMY